MFYLYIAILLIVVILFIAYQIFGFKQLAPWIPSKSSHLQKALDYLNLPSGSTFVDLGSGDGRAVFTAVKNGYIATGIEISPLLWIISRLRQIFGRHQVKLIQGSIYDHDISNYDVIFTFGLPETMADKLGVKIKQAKNSAWLISYTFSLPGYEPEKVIQDKWRKVLIYRL